MHLASEGQSNSTHLFSREPVLEVCVPLTSSFVSKVPPSYRALSIKCHRFLFGFVILPDVPLEKFIPKVTFFLALLSRLSGTLFFFPEPSLGGV